MRSTLDELERELDELRDFLASIAHVGEALSTHPDPEVRRFAALRRRFDNAAFVVALYATFESYVEKLVAAFATLEAQRLPYFDLPQKLAAKHLQRSADLLARGRLGEGRHAGLTPASVVANLYNCLTGVTPYALNAAAVVWHDNNLRAKDVDEIFLHLGVEDVCTQVRRGDAMVQWYMAAQGIETPPAKGVPSTVIEERLNDLVERRNEVAHRGGNPEDLLGVSDMEEAIGFVRALSSDIFAVVVGRYLAGRYGPNSNAAKLSQVAEDGPYQDGTVLIVHGPNVELAVGQPVFASRQSGPVRWGRIQSLSLDGADHQSIAAGTPTPRGIGVLLDFACSSKSVPIVLAAEDDLVWPPRPPEPVASPSKEG